MSFVAYILLASFWVIAIWALSVFSTKLLKFLAGWPEYWLAIIFVAFGTPILAWALIVIGAVPLGTITGLTGIMDVQVLSDGQDSSTIMNVLKAISWIAYITGFSYFLVRLAVGWGRLYRAANTGYRETHLGHNIIVTINNVPLCAIGVLRPVILCPHNTFQSTVKIADIKIRDLLIAHEAAHIRNRDPLVMFCLLIIKAFVWPHPAIHDLFKRWQLSSELRADNLALCGESIDTRKRYGQKLVSILRRSGVKNGKGILPCPSATLNLSNYRSAKMRVNNILDDKIKPRKTASEKIRMGVVALITTLVGSYGLAAVASPTTSDKDAQPSVRVPPIFPVNCTANTGKYAASVAVKFDVDKFGSVENIRIIKTDNSCFNQATINSIAKWKYEPALRKGKRRKRTGVQTMVKFMLAEN